MAPNRRARGQTKAEEDGTSKSPPTMLRRSQRVKKKKLCAGKPKDPARSFEQALADSTPILSTPSKRRGAVKQKSPTKSPFFHKPAKRPSLKRQSSSRVFFPPLTAPTFGLVQERLYHDPFRLLVAVLFLNRTKGMHSMPVFFRLIEQYPTPRDVANAPFDDLVEAIRHLGFQNQRARKLIAFARLWLEEPPDKERRFRTLNYPNPGDGKDIKAGEVLLSDDERQSALEIAHLPGLGRYAWDSWRIFCRDQLRGLAKDYNGTGAQAGFEPEWKRVIPEDKELRPCLRWMWLKEGWDWNPLTGDKHQAAPELVHLANAGKLDWHEPAVHGESDLVINQSSPLPAVDDIPAESAPEICKRSSAKPRPKPRAFVVM